MDVETIAKLNHLTHVKENICAMSSLFPIPSTLETWIVWAMTCMGQRHCAK